MCVELKIKLKSLAEEQRIIRKEELKHKGKWSWKAETLIAHRKFIVRPIIRSTHIAYGLIRGLEYHEIENYSKSYPDWDAVRVMVKKYGSREDMQILEVWIDNNLMLNKIAA